MPTIGRLKDNDLLISGEVSERLPSVMNGLIATYPMDSTTETASLWKMGWAKTVTANGTIQDYNNSAFPVVGTQKVRFSGYFKMTGLNGTSSFYVYTQLNGAWNWQAATISNSFIEGEWVYIEREITVNGTLSDKHNNYSQGISVRNDNTTGKLEWKNCHCYAINVGSYESNVTKNIDDLELKSTGDISLPKELLRQNGTLSFDFYPTSYSNNNPIFSTRMDGGFDLLMQSTSSGTLPSYWRMYSNTTLSVQRTGNWFPALNKWYNVTVTWVNNGLAVLYVDGVVVSAMDNCGDWFTYFNSNANARLSLGSGIRSASPYKYKNVSIYNKALSGSEVLSLMHSKINLTPEGHLITKKIIENSSLTIPMRNYINKVEIKGNLKENQTLL